MKAIPAMLGLAALAGCGAAPARPDLSFRFPADFSFSLRVQAENSHMQGAAGAIQTIELRGKGRVGDAKGGRPGRLELYELAGPQEFKPVGGFESDRERTENRGGAISGDVDEAWRLINAKDAGHLSDDILLVYPAGPVFGFVPPPAGVPVGGKWPSGDVLPAGPKTISKRQFVFSEAKGEFELAEHAGGKARVVWTGTAKAETKGRAAKSAFWRSTVGFDCRAGRTDSVETELTIELEDGIVVRHKVSASFAYP